MNLTQIRIIIIHTYNALTHSVASSLLHYFQFFCFFIHSKVIITHTQKETAILLILFSSFAHQPPFSHFFTSHNFPLCKKEERNEKTKAKLFHTRCLREAKLKIFSTSKKLLSKNTFQNVLDVSILSLTSELCIIFARCITRNFLLFLYIFK